MRPPYAPTPGTRLHHIEATAEAGGKLTSSDAEWLIRLASLIGQMRAAQREWFATHNREALGAAVAFEKLVDAQLRQPAALPTLFDEAAPEA